MGLTITAFAAENYKVVGFDSNEHIVKQLNSGKSHIEGVSSDLIARAISAGRYKATNKGIDIDGSDVIVYTG